MEYLFQADINGSLERLDRIENGHEDSDHRSSTEIIIGSLKSTLDSLDSKQKFVYNQAPGHQTELQDPEDACHAVLFNAWIGRTDALTSFSVSRYPRGILPNEYYQIVESLNFTNNFKTSIYALDPKVAISGLHELLPHIETCRLYNYLPIYLRVHQSIKSEESCTFAIDQLCQNLSYHTLDISSVQQLLSTLLSFYASNIQLSTYHCIGYYRLVTLLHHSSQGIIKAHLLYTWKRLLKLIHGKYNTVLSSANMELLLIDLDKVAPNQVIIDINDTVLRDDSTDSNMVELWNRSSATTTSPHRRHEYAFELICMGIWKNSVPCRNTTITYDQPTSLDGLEAKQQFSTKWSSACNVLSTHLLALADNEKVELSTDLYSCMKASLTTLKELSGSWKSIVKAMTQFSDIWVRALPNNECIAAFADLIVLAETWTCLYQFVINVINAPSGEGHFEIVSEQQKSSLCALVRLVIKQLETNALLELIYDTYSDRSLPIDKNTSSPFKHDLFDDMATLQKCCNQFVHVEQDDEKPYDDLGEQNQAQPHILHQLAMLATLSPYETVWRLVNQGIENKGQHDLVVSILRQLGDLCMLRRYTGDKSLFGHIVGSVLSRSRVYTKLDMLAPILLSCWKHARNPSTSILLDSYTSITCSTSKNQIIICPKELLDDCLLPALRQNEDPTLTNDILGVFYALTEDTSPASEKWERQLEQHVSHIPIILDMDVDILMKTLANVMDKRYSTDDNDDTLSHRDTQGARTLGLSIALDLGRKLTMTIRHVFTLFKNTPERTVDVKLKLLHFYDCLDDYDWRTRLFWQEGYRYVTGNDSLPLYIPPAAITLLQSITDSGGKNGDFLWVSNGETNMDLDSDQQWTLMLNGCRSTTLFTDELFKYASTRIYNMGPVWKHPYECSSFHEQLTRNLHPSFSTAAHYEYRLLLIYFLGQLYDVHGNDDVMHLYHHYDSIAVPLVKLLTTEHCRIFFMALHSILLLKTPNVIKATCDMEGKNLEDGELYFVSGIVQTIQAMTNWQQIGMDDSTHAAQNLTRKQISSMALYLTNAIEPSDSTNPEVTEKPATETTNSSNSANTMDPTTNRHTKQQDIIDCYYPWANDNRFSGRALYLLMIEAICHVSKSVSLRKSYDVLRVLLLQMVEGLEDRQERDTFMDQCHNKQTKAFINKWKKNKKDKRIRVHMRPILAPNEMELIKSCYTHLPYTEDQAILHKLLTPSPSPSPILYIYNSHN